MLPISHCAMMRDMKTMPWKRLSPCTAALLFVAVGGGLLFAAVSYVGRHDLWPPMLDVVGRYVWRVVRLSSEPTMTLGRYIWPLNAMGKRPEWWFILMSAVTPACYAAVLFAVQRFCRGMSRWFATNTKPVNQSRLRFLVMSSGAGVSLLGATGAYGSVLAPQRLRTANYTVPIRDLPKALDGLRIVQVSDTHFGPIVTLPYLRAMVEKVNALTPDLVLLTGDYVSDSHRYIADGVGLFRDLRARLGIVGVLGNHDHWEGAGLCRTVFDQIGIPLVDNGRLFLTPAGIQEDAREEALCLAGLGDLWTEGVDFAKALDGVPDSMPRLVLAHNPDTAEQDAGGRRVDLMFSGHTHGGQVWIPGLGAPMLPSRFGQKYAGGLVQGPQWPVIVSRGVGMVGIPIRLGVPPELVLVTLTRG